MVLCSFLITHSICMMFPDLPYQSKCNKFLHIKGEVQSKICLEQSCYSLCKPKEVFLKNYSIHLVTCEHSSTSCLQHYKSTVTVVIRTFITTLQELQKGD